MKVFGLMPVIPHKHLLVNVFGLKIRFDIQKQLCHTCNESVFRDSVRP